MSGGCSLSFSHLNDDGVKQSLIWKLLMEAFLPPRHEHLGVCCEDTIGSLIRLFHLDSVLAVDETNSGYTEK